MATNSSNSSGANMGASGSNRPDSIKDALRVLDEALAQEGGANLKDLVTNDYQHLKSAISGVSPRISESIRSFGTQAFDRVSSMATDYGSTGMDKSREIFSTVDTTLRSNPWPVIGGVAVGTFALGFILGRSGSRSSGSAVSYEQ